MSCVCNYSRYSVTNNYAEDFRRAKVEILLYMLNPWSYLLHAHVYKVTAHNFLINHQKFIDRPSSKWKPFSKSISRTILKSIAQIYVNDTKCTSLQVAPQILRRRNDCIFVHCSVVVLRIHRSNKRIVSHAWIVFVNRRLQSVSRKWNFEK